MVRVVPATIAVTLARATAAWASVGSVLEAAVGGEGVGDSVGLPDVHLIAAETLVVHVGLYAGTLFRIISKGKTKSTHQSVDEVVS